MKNIERILAGLLSFLILYPTVAHAWNALGHKVIAEIAWQTLSPEKQSEIADTLKRHPRYAEDFRDLETDQEIFLHAATWPDIARGIRGPDRDKFDKPIWHYVNFPIGEADLNLSSDPKDTKSISWNVMQATNFCLGVLKSNAPPQQKALAYSWLFHLVGDAHQPMHSTALFNDRYPKGDRGGNLIKLVKGGNLHKVWDNLLGRSHKLNDVKQEVIKLKNQGDLWEVDTTGNITDWVKESHELATSFAYNDVILNSTDELIFLENMYYKQAGAHARARIVAAGLRLASLLESLPIKLVEDQIAELTEEIEPKPKPPVVEERVTQTLTSNKKWYQGGTLHDKGALDWQNADPKDKLATCADFIAVMWNNGNLKPHISNKINSVDDIKPFAFGLATFLDKATERHPDPKKNAVMYTNQTVAEFSTLGMIMMDWVE